MTRKRHRLRRFAKWAGLLFCILMVGACVQASWTRTYVFGNYNEFFARLGPAGMGVWKEPRTVSIRFTDRFMVYRHKDSREPWQLLPGFYSHRGNKAGVMIPSWMLFSFIAIPTYILWRRDRRHPPGHCQKCGYDLTKNESGTCPECGTAIDLIE